MKALVIKDCYVLLKQLKIFLVIIVVSSLLPGMSSGIFAVIYAGMLPYSALAYDDRSKWDQLAAMMPYSNRDIVAGKYVLGYLFIAASAALTFAVQFLLQPFTHTPASVVDTLLLLCVAALLIAITMPFIFRFGVEKGRMLFIIVIVGVSSLAGISVASYADSGVAPALLSLVLPIAAVVVNAISIPLSVRMYARRNR